MVTTHTIFCREPQMNIHDNARTTPRSRLVMMERLDAGWAIIAVASCFGIDARTVRKWRDRYRSEGLAGLMDRSSRPCHCPARLDAEVEEQIIALRRLRLSGPAIARRLCRPISTIGKVLRRRGLGRPSFVTSATSPANSFMSIPRSSAGSTASAIASPEREWIYTTPSKALHSVPPP